jgi:hypothetical protein
MNGTKRKLCRWLPALAAGLAGMFPPTASADGQHELLLLPSVDLLGIGDQSPPDTIESDARAAADLFYSYTGGRFRVLGEYLLSTDESELERLQAGWSLTDHTMLWFGRFHSPASFWISEFHHGHYLQTSITRPSLEQWEDENGAVPAHVTGFNLEFHKDLQSGAGLGISIGAGLAPKFIGDGLTPFDMLDPESGHGPSFSMRVAYRPDLFATVQYGILASWNEIEVVQGSNPDLEDLERIDQLAAGVFADVQWHDWRVITSVVYYNNELRYDADHVSDSYLLAYLQPEYSLTDNVVAFGRVDIGDGEDDSVFLDLLPTFISHRHMLGLRWDFAKSQAVTVEVADTSQQGDEFEHEHYKEIRLQWSAVIR